MRERPRSTGTETQRASRRRFFKLLASSPLLATAYPLLPSSWQDGIAHEAVIYDRAKLCEGMSVPGPAIVSEMDSTTVILPGYAARVDAVGNLLIDRTPA